MNYIIYPKEQKNIIYPWQINHTVCVKVQHNIFILNQKSKRYPQKKKERKCTFLIPVIMIRSHQLPVTTDPELTALKGNRPGTKVGHLLKKKRGQICTFEIKLGGVGNAFGFLFSETM